MTEEEYNGLLAFLETLPAWRTYKARVVDGEYPLSMAIKHCLDNEVVRSRAEAQLAQNHLSQYCELHGLSADSLVTQP